MFWKVLVAAVVAIAAAFLTQSVGITVATFLIAMVVVLIIEGMRVVPQQQAWVVERLGKFHEVLQPGLNLIVPFIDRVAYRHSLKEVPLDVPEQVCITKDNTQLARGRHHLLPGDRSAARLLRLLGLRARRSRSSRRRRCAARSARWSWTRPSRAATRSTTGRVRRSTRRGAPGASRCCATRSRASRRRRRSCARCRRRSPRSARSAR